MSFLLLIDIIASSGSLIICSGYYDDYLTFDFLLREMIMKLLQCATGFLFVELTYLTTHASLPVGTEHGGKLLEGFDQPKGALVEDECALFGSQGCDGGLPTLLVGQEANEGELVAGKTRIDKGRHKCCGAWQALYIDTFFGCFAHQQEAWIADTWGSCISNKRYGLTGEESIYNIMKGLMLIEDMIGLHGGGNIVVLQEHSRGACIFGEDEVNVLEHFDSSEGKIGQIAHRRGDKI